MLPELSGIIQSCFSSWGVALEPALGSVPKTGFFFATEHRGSQERLAYGIWGGGKKGLEI